MLVPPWRDSGKLWTAISWSTASMSNANKIPGARRLQYGALPYRTSNGQRAEFMLVTSRETRRWIIPKGWPKKGRSPHRSAALDLLRARSERPRRRRAAECSRQFPPSNGDCHTPLPCEVRKGTIPRHEGAVFTLKEGLDSGAGPAQPKDERLP